MPNIDECPDVYIVGESRTPKVTLVEPAYRPIQRESGGEIPNTIWLIQEGVNDGYPYLNPDYEPEEEGGEVE